MKRILEEIGHQTICNDAIVGNLVQVLRQVPDEEFDAVLARFVRILSSDRAAAYRLLSRVAREKPEPIEVKG